MANHIKVDGKLLQVNKPFSQLKNKQKEFIFNTFKEKYHQKMAVLGTSKNLSKKHRDEVLDVVYEEIQKKDIWIPYEEVEKSCYSKIVRIVRQYNKK